MKDAPFLKPASQGIFSNDNPMLIGEPFYELLVGMVSETLFNFFSERLQIDRRGHRRRRDGRWPDGRDARRRTVKSATPRPAIQKLATARFVDAIYLWFVIGDWAVQNVALSDMVLICRHTSAPTSPSPSPT